jgi:tetratricopeptide (TPR) repeat protein
MKALALLLAFAVAAPAQEILMKDGRVIATKGLRRQGDTIMATVDITSAEPGKPALRGELGYPLGQIAQLHFPEPPALRAAPDLIAQGKGLEALTQLEPVVAYFAGFRDAPGSWWPQAALLKVQALASLDRDPEAVALAEQIAQISVDPAIQRVAHLQIAASLSRRGEIAKALPIAEAAMRESKDAAARAPAALIRGESLLAKKEWDDAVLAFVEVPVLYPQERPFVPRALLGKARALLGSDDFTAARAALEELRNTYPATLESKQIESELQKIARREKALAEPQ